MIYFNNFTQGLYDSVPYATFYLPGMDDGMDLVHSIIDALPKSLINVTYIAEEDNKAVINLIFNARNLIAKDLSSDLVAKVFPEGSLDSYTKRVVGNHTYLTCEISL